MSHFYSAELQTIVVMITESKVTKLFCMTDDVCTFFNAMKVYG